MLDFWQLIFGRFLLKLHVSFLCGNITDLKKKKKGRPADSLVKYMLTASARIIILSTICKKLFSTLYPKKMIKYTEHVKYLGTKKLLKNLQY